MSFRDRQNQHDDYTKTIIHYLNDRGLIVIPIGMENYLKSQHDVLMLNRNHPISIFIRFFPDYLLNIGHTYYLFDIKSPSEHHSNIAIELDALNLYQLLGWLNIHVFLIIKDNLCCWASNVFLKKKYTNVSQLTTNKGSGTPFGLIDETNTTLVPIAQFIDKLIFLSVSHPLGKLL